ncbi:MAG: 3-deoxy-manno-octulosonate cytidylyltransferase [Planctomycetota bacterium]
MSIVIVIPARLHSTRLPEKLLRRVGGKSILQHTYDQARRANSADRVIVAVDDESLMREVIRFGGQAEMTSPTCASGTDRVAEIATRIDAEILVNVQGDEPEIDPAAIDLVAQALAADPMADIATLATPIRSTHMLKDPGCVKIAMRDAPGDATGVGQAIYFSRSVIPHPRGGVTDPQLNQEPPLFWHHIGLYAYRRQFLRWFANQPPSSLEQTESLEQLRAVEAGKRIVVCRTESAASGIDTEADLTAFAGRYSAGQNS